MVWVMLADREEMLTTAPRPTVSTICRAASLVSVSGAVTLKAKVLAMKPSLVSRAARGMAPPALLTRMSRRPNSSTAPATSRSSSASTVTSVGTTRARRPRARTSPATSSRSDSVRAASTTSAPASASPSAIPATDPQTGTGDDGDPTPDVEPVEDQRPAPAVSVWPVPGTSVRLGRLLMWSGPPGRRLLGVAVPGILPSGRNRVGRAGQVHPGVPRSSASGRPGPARGPPPCRGAGSSGEWMGNGNREPVHERTGARRHRAG